MAWAEKLPSGKWRAAYRLTAGEKRSAGTFAHKRAAVAAATDAEVKTRKPGALDPRKGLITWGDWRQAWWPSRVIELQTADTEGVHGHLFWRWWRRCG